MIYAFAVCLGLFLATLMLAVGFYSLWRFEQRNSLSRIRELEDRLFLKSGLPTRSEKVESTAEDAISELTLGSERRDAQKRQLYRTMPDGEERRNEQRDALRKSLQPNYEFLTRGSDGSDNNTN